MHPRLTPQQAQPEVKPLATHIVAVLDESGSMLGNAAETISAFNKFLDEQKKLPGECHLSLVKFNSVDIPVHQRKVLADVPALNAQTYAPEGYTALLDAMGRAIEFASKDSDVIVCVITDGGENSSRSYNQNQIKALVEERTKAGWNFIYLSADLNAFAHAASYGVPMANVVRTAGSPLGMSASVGAMSQMSSKYRSGDKSINAGEVEASYNAGLKK